jgi:hypothetical protein
VSSALWYLQRLSCRDGYRCDETADRLLRIALNEPDLEKRSNLIAQCDSAFIAANNYIPLASPARWSLVGSDLINWRKSSFSVHPLQHLREGL